MNRTALLAVAIPLAIGCQAPEESLPAEAVASITKAATEWDACAAPLEVLLNLEANRALGTAVETFIAIDTVSANGPTEHGGALLSAAVKMMRSHLEVIEAANQAYAAGDLLALTLAEHGIIPLAKAPAPCSLPETPTGGR